VGAAEDAFAVLDPVADDPAAAVHAHRRDLLNGAFESNVPTVFWYRISIVRR
jgi:hypothetical protein